MKQLSYGYVAIVYKLAQKLLFDIIIYNRKLYITVYAYEIWNVYVATGDGGDSPPHSPHSNQNQHQHQCQYPVQLSKTTS